MDINLIEQKLESIYKEIMISSNDLSLYSGMAGKCLFALLYCQYFKEGKIDDNLKSSIQEIIDGYLDVRPYSLASGKAGINWLYLQMYNWELIETNDLEEICVEDINLFKTSIFALSSGNYDFLHGSLGIAYYLLARKADTKLMTEYFKELELLFTKRKDGMISSYDLSNNIIEQDKVNLSLSHGIVSILKFCLQCYKEKICVNQAQSLGERIISYLINMQNLNKDKCYFPNFVLDHRQDNQQSRLAWCYGDLTTAFVLFQSALTFDDKDLEKFALEVFNHTMSRTKEDQTFVKDAGICHGSSGIAHIYNKMWHSTGEVIFREACDYWMDRTLKYSINNDTVSGFKMYDAQSRQYQTCQGLLEGTSGIGLVLLSYLTGDFSWDYCIMLN
jgi:hypothetical protein